MDHVDIEFSLSAAHSPLPEVWGQAFCAILTPDLAMHRTVSFPPLCSDSRSLIGGCRAATKHISIASRRHPVHASEGGGHGAVGRVSGTFGDCGMEARVVRRFAATIRIRHSVRYSSGASPSSDLNRSAHAERHCPASCASSATVQRRAGSPCSAWRARATWGSASADSHHFDSASDDIG